MKVLETAVLPFIIVALLAFLTLQPGFAIMLLLLSVVLYKRVALRVQVVDFGERALSFVRKYSKWIIVIQCLIYAFAYNSLLPEGMYFSPDSILYLSISNIVPPSFALLGRALIDIEVALGSERILLLRYVVIFVFSMGGWLIARALLRSGRPLLAIFVLPAIWSMGSLSQWFNYFLTDGIATAFLVACIGAYANLFVSIQNEESMRASRFWLVLFVLLGMISFTFRPAFAFIVPVMILMIMNRTIFSWRRLGGAMAGIAILVAAHFSFAIYWHGQAPSQLGGVLTALVFDLPVPDPCPSSDETDLCNTQRALEPFIQASREAGSAHKQYLYKVLNNGPVVSTARAAVRGNDPNYAVLKEIALLKIKSNPLDYIQMVLVDSYYSVKSWGDWAWNDSLGSIAMVNIGNTNNVAQAVTAKMAEVAHINFDPTIKQSPPVRFYKDFMFQLPRLIVRHHLVSHWILAILLIVLVFSVRALLVTNVSLPEAILFSCSLFAVVGIVFQNAFFPVIPRLLDPFHPLAALGALMLGSMLLSNKMYLFSLWKNSSTKISNYLALR